MNLGILYDRYIFMRSYSPIFLTLLIDIEEGAKRKFERRKNNEDRDLALNHDDVSSGEN